MLVPSWNALKWDPAVRRACAHLLRIHKILKLFKYFLLSLSLERKHPQYTELTGCIQQVTSPTGSHLWLHQGCFYAVLSTRCESEIKTWIRENLCQPLWQAGREKPLKAWVCWRQWWESDPLRSCGCERVVHGWRRDNEVLDPAECGLCAAAAAFPCRRALEPDLTGKWPSDV